MNKFNLDSIKVALVVIFLLTIPALLPLFKLGFFPTQDFIHVARLAQMHEALLDGHFPVRWARDFRYGEPLYNFYAPLPYYFGASLKIVGDIVQIKPSFLDLTKLLFGLSFIFSGWAMYLFAKEILGKWGGLLASILYIYAPYHSVDVYVRGAMSESIALIFFPLIFLGAYKLYQKVAVGSFLLLSLSLAGLFYTHNIMTMIFSPFVLLWFGTLVVIKRSLKLAISYILSFVLGVGLGASFLFPALFEKQFVQAQYLNTGYFDFRGHFVAIPQWFSEFWGYGASLWGSQDDMSFQVGLTHWMVLSLTMFILLISLILVKFRFLKTKFKLIFEDLSVQRQVEIYGIALYLLAAFVLSLFMMHNQSAPIWERFSSLLSFTQFPWRFLGVSIFFISVLGGVLMVFLNKRFLPIFTLLIVIAVIALNVKFFRPDSYYLDSVDEHYTSKRILIQDDKLPKDYLPIFVKSINRERFESPRFVEKEGIIENYKLKTGQVDFRVKTENGGTIETPLTYFPGWIVLIDGEKTKILEPDNFGLIRFEVSPGEHSVRVKFADSTVRSSSNFITLFSLFVVIFLSLKVIRKFKSSQVKT